MEKLTTPPTNSQPRDDVSGILYQFIEVGEFLALLKLLNKVLLQVL
jgi:hypothetical protein